MDWDQYVRDDFLQDLDLDVQNLEGNPLIDHQLGRLRDRETEPYEYEERTKTLASAMCYEVAAELPQEQYTVETPLAETDASEVTDAVLVPILRAGLAARDGADDAFMDLESGFISAWRDEDLDVETEYAKLPDLDGKTVVLTDPMVATGNTVSAVYESIEQHHNPERYVVMSFIAVPEGLQRIDDELPDDTAVYTCAIDDEVYEDDFASPGLNEHGYIVPGLGDAGDRTYATPDQ